MNHNSNYLPMKYSLAFLLIVYAATSNAQEVRKTKSYTRYTERIKAAETSAEKVQYARLWLSDARSDKNYVEEVAAIRDLMYIDDRSKLTAYADTLLNAAVETGDSRLIGQAYLTKGIAHYYFNKHAAALDSYMKADLYLAGSKMEYDIYKLKYAIGNTKYYLGFYHEAISLFKQCEEHYRDNDDRGYLNALYSLGLCYNRLNDYDLCKIYNRLGIEEGKKRQNQKMQAYFQYSNGINEYHLRNYNHALRELKSALPQLEDKEDFSNIAVAWFYIGKINLALGHDKMGLDYLRKVDSSFSKNQNYIRPDLRQTYEILITNYRKKHDETKELFYTRRLLSIDSVLTRDYKYLSSTLNKEYDTKELIDNNIRISRAMKVRNILDIFGVNAFLAIVFFLIVKYVRLRRYHKNYLKMMAGPVREISSETLGDDAKVETFPVFPAEQIQSESNQEADKAAKELRPETRASALKKLEQFEKEQKFRESTIGLHELSQILEINTKYTSWLLNNHRGKGTIEYLRDLRLTFIVQMLRTSIKYRNYTDEALAGECGFGSTRSFTRAFNATFGMPPRYFINQLKKDLED